MSSRTSVLALVVVVGCARAQTSGPPDARVIADAAAVDAPTGTPDAPATPDAPTGTPDAPDLADAATDAASSPDATTTTGAVHLLLSEIQLAPAGGEFIEIVNPTTTAVALDDYYLSDNGTYFRLPANTQSLDSGDFIARFKAGSTIAGHGVVTVALDTAANFMTAESVAPTYSLADGTITTVASSGTPSLTNGGELVVLFYWDGQSDLVTDVDLMLAGAPTSGNGVTAKSGVAIDGPDAGTATTAYKTDADTIANQGSAPGSGKSTKRVALEAGHETQAGAGNGVGGDDETSEATGATWDTAFTAPTPGVVPAALLP